MNNLTSDEMETHFNIVSNDRGKIVVFSDDPVWMARLDKISKAVKVIGAGKEYELRADQLVIRKGKKQISEAQRVKLSERLAMLRNS